MVRIAQIVLRRFKNINYGEINFTKSKPGTQFQAGADIIGIYGQNGSGKTSVIEAIELIKTLMTGEAYDTDVVLDYFYPGESSFSIELTFNVKTVDKVFTVQYDVTFSRKSRLVWISHERLISKQFDDNRRKWDSKRSLFELDQEAPEAAAVLLPKSSWNYLLNSDQQLKMSLLVSLGVHQQGHLSPMFALQTYKYLRSLELCDFGLYKADLPPSNLVFNGDIFDLQSKSFQTAHNKTLVPLMDIITELSWYFASRVNVFTTLANATCSLNFLSMDILDERGYGRKGHLSVNLFEPGVLKEDDFEVVSSALKRVSGLIGSLVPGLSVKVREVGTQLMDEGDTLAKQVEFLSCRDGVEIPLRCESEGIRKLISFSLRLMEVHSYSDSFLAVDELDSGIFEYLLGELLSVIESFGKGQLLFTAHNLRVLELLPTSEIILATSDPNNRFERFKGVKPTNNPRDQYLRTVSLGGSGSHIYVPTNKYQIDAALCLGGGE